MAWYRANTVSVTNGNATVTGSGTAFIANVSIGEGFLGPDGRTYEITDIPSNTSLTISPAYLGSTASGQSYAILPARGRIADLIAETQSLLASFATVRDGIGAGLFPDGTAAAPGVRFSGDQDTGIYRLSANVLGFVTGGVGRAFVNGSGNFGIGTSDPTARLDVAGAENSAQAHFGAIASRGLLVGTQVVDGVTDAGSYLSAFGAGSGTFIIFTEGLERLRIASNGNVGIGTTSPSLLFQVAARGGFASDGTVSWGQALTGNNRGFLSWNTDIASINAVQSLVLGASGGGSTVRLEASGLFRPGIDNSQNFGSGSFRWGTIFAGTGTINTSDEREKHWRGKLNAAELRAAERIIGELGIYQWNDAVEEKGEDGARLHFGVRAQRAFAIMEDEGLDWGRYAWACYDQWEEQTEPVMEEVTVPKTRKVMRPSTLIDPATGQPAMVEVDEAYEETEMQPTGETRVTLEAGDRYGVRPDQLAFWLIAAQAAMQADMEARLAALEGAA